jgi:hypothetical protein
MINVLLLENDDGWTLRTGAKKTLREVVARS